MQDQQTLESLTLLRLFRNLRLLRLLKMTGRLSLLREARHSGGRRGGEVVPVLPTWVFSQVGKLLVNQDTTAFESPIQWGLPCLLFVFEAAHNLLSCQRTSKGCFLRTF